MQQQIISIGILLIFIGTLMLIIGSLVGVSKGQNKVDAAIGGFIGPIPFGFFTSKRIFWIWIIIFLILLSFFLLRRFLV